MKSTKNFVRALIALSFVGCCSALPLGLYLATTGCERMVMGAILGTMTLVSAGLALLAVGIMAMVKEEQTLAKKRAATKFATAPVNDECLNFSRSLLPPIDGSKHNEQSDLLGFKARRLINRNFDAA